MTGRRVTDPLFSASYATFLLGCTVEMDAFLERIPNRRWRLGRCRPSGTNAFCGLPVVNFFPCPAILCFPTFLCFSRRQSSNSGASEDTLALGLASKGNGFLWIFRGARQSLCPAVEAHDETPCCERSCARQALGTARLLFAPENSNLDMN